MRAPNAIEANHLGWHRVTSSIKSVTGVVVGFHERTANSYAAQIPPGSGDPMDDVTKYDDVAALQLLKGGLAASDSECLLWEQEHVMFARQQFEKHWGQVPSV